MILSHVTAAHGKRNCKTLNFSRKVFVMQDFVIRVLLDYYLLRFIKQDDCERYKTPFLVGRVDLM